MKSKALMASAFATALALSSAAYGAILNWSRASAPDGSFSIETLCTRDEVAGYANAPEEITDGLTLKRDSRVVCVQDGLVLTAGVMDLGGMGGSGKVFDELLAEMAKDQSANKPNLIQIGGRRALVNRETVDGNRAMTAFVEIDASHLLFMVAGFQSESGAGPNEQDQVIDRFMQSLKIAGK